MSANLESSAHFIGKEGLNWWIGQIENDGSTPEDYDYTGKVKVRIVGYHNPSKAILPTKDLPWATCIMPVTEAQRGGIGSIHQLQISSWVVGFFMDGSSAQIPIIMGTISDENPKGKYVKEGDSAKGYQPLLPPDYKPKKHGEGGGSTVGGTASTVAKKPTGQLTKPAAATGGTKKTGSNNPRGEGSGQTDIQKKADKDKCYRVDVANGKCGSPPDKLLEGPLAEFMKFARGIEKNEIGEFINSTTGKVEDLAGEIEAIAGRIQQMMKGILGNIKGTVLKEVEKFIQKTINEIQIPNPDILDPVKDQLKNFSDLINCLFKQILNELLPVITGMLMDLLEQALDVTLCLVQDLVMDMLGNIMDKVMEGIQNILGIVSGVLSAIKGAAGAIQGLTSKILALIDMICDGDLSCALGLSTFETCHGPNESEEDKNKKQQSQYSDAAKEKIKSSKARVVGTGKPNSRGYVPVETYNPETGNYEKKGLNTKTGEITEVGASGTGITSGSFEKGKSLVEKFDSVYPIRDSDGQIQMSSLNCNPANLNKKPCFPELIFDNAQSTSLIRALPIIDDIGSIVGVYMKNKGSNINTTASVRAMFTCNEPEGTGAKMTPIIQNGRIDRIRVDSPGVGYGLDPDNTYCPTEQRIYLIDNLEIQDYVDEGGFLYVDETVQADPNKPFMQVVEFNYNNTELVGIATLDKEQTVPAGVRLYTAGNAYSFILNPKEVFYDLAIPANATAIYAGCPDLIPVLDQLGITNVGEGYTNPKIVIGDDEIGHIQTDKKGRLLEPVLTVKAVGNVRPTIKDPTGYGGVLVPTYNYVGPTKFKEIYNLNEYIDCVGHPGVK